MFTCDVPPDNRTVTKSFVKFTKHYVDKETRKQILLNEASSAKLLRKFAGDNTSKITMMDERDLSQSKQVRNSNHTRLSKALMLASPSALTMKQSQ